MSTILLRWAAVVSIAAAAASAQDGKKPEKSDPQEILRKRIIAQPGVRAIVRPLAVRRVEKVQPPKRRRIVYRVQHVPATDLANTVGELLESELQAAAAPATKSQPVAMVADPITNSLLISATPAVCEQVLELVEKLDQRPQMVSVEVLIAEVSIGPNDDPKTNDPAGVLDELGAPVSEKSLPDLAAVLAKRPGVRLVARPRITALSNQPAYLQFGQRVPRITGATMSPMGRSSSARGPIGRTNRVQLENVGLSLGFTARLNAEGLVTMEIELEQSHLGPPEEGVPVHVPDEGPPTYSPGVELLTLKTTVSAASGQTVILGGITAKKEARHSELILLLSPRIVPAK